MKTVAIDIDDTLNNFSEILGKLEIKQTDYDYIEPEKFDEYVDIIKNEKPFDGNKYKFMRGFKNDVHRKCYEIAEARPDAVKFMNWLKENNWRIVILTYRDLRYSLEITKEWLRKNNMPYDYIFGADNKSLFCKAWTIKHFIDDEIINLISAPAYEINMYYPINDKNRNCETKAMGFNNYSELYSEFGVD